MPVTDTQQQIVIYNFAAIKSIVDVNCEYSEGGGVSQLLRQNFTERDVLL